MMKTTDDTTPWGAAPDPEGSPKSSAAATCGGCRILKPLGGGAGWCLVWGQYRAINIFRLCDEFRSRNTERKV